MTGLLVTQAFYSRFRAEIHKAAADNGIDLDPIVLGDERGTTLAPELRDRVDIAFLSGDLYPGNFRGFLESASACPNLGWLHLFYVGVQGGPYAQFLERGVRVTNSAGASGQNIAQTAIGGVLMLSRPFLPWLQAQRDHAWRQLPSGGPEAPRDLRDETMVIVGIGAIGSEIARLARALDLRVVGVRRSQEAAEHVDELVPPSRLDDVLGRADWLTLACPLTEQTRGLIDARRIGLLPRGARIVNVARGAVIDEEAMIEALRSGHLAGAYLDVFAREPLPPESPLWDLPNVIVTPHNSTTSASKYQREAELFLENLARWGAGRPLRNQVLSLE